MLNLGLSFFFKLLQIQISQFSTWSGPTLFSYLLVNSCSLISDKNLGEIQCLVYKIIQSIHSSEMHHTFMHAHTPTHNLWFWPKRPPLAFCLAETSVAEMSGPIRPWPKCPWPKCPTFGKNGMGCFVQVTKTAWDVLSGVANWCGMFCPGWQKMAWDVLSRDVLSYIGYARLLNIIRISQKEQRVYWVHKLSPIKFIQVR